LIAELFFETRCNLNCWHCSSSDYINKTASLTVRQIQIILKKLKSVGVLSLCFVGGEPTINRDLETIIRLTNRYKIIPSLITNALLLNKEKIDSLFESGLGNMGFSLQSMEAKTHDVLVNRSGAFDQLIRLVEYCLQKKYPCSLCVVPTNENLRNGDFDKMVKFSQRHNIRINANLPAAIGRLSGDISTLLTKSSVEKLVRDYFPLDNFLPDFKQIKLNTRIYCPMGTEGVYILPDGEVCPCTFTHISFGNILHEPINLILQRMEKSDLLNKLNRNQCPISMDREFIKKINNIIQQSKEYPPRWHQFEKNN
jgi:MoaA/NifB/PqqE/SkfB family radical SAM enzyme